MTSHSPAAALLRDIETAQVIEGCSFDEAFRTRLATVHAEATAERGTVQDTVASEIRDALAADRDLDIPRKNGWHRLFGTPAYQDRDHRVLRNLVGVRSPVILDALAGRLCALRMTELPRHPPATDGPDLLALHGGLFGDVFGWAGHRRTVNLSRQGVDFAPVPTIDHHLQIAAAHLKECQSQLSTGGLDSLCSFLAEFLWCHPFRDGNGRTAMAVVITLTSPGALSTVSRAEWYAASAASLQVPGYPDPEPWAPLVQRMLDH